MKNSTSYKKVHGHTLPGKVTATWRAWSHAKQRCLNQKDKSFPRYGGRGIQMCKSWVESFENFLKDMGEKPQGFQLERINNDGNYEPSNCRWATVQDQANNKRNNRLFTFQGQTLTLAQWARKAGVKYKLIHTRINKYGWNLERAITTN